MSLTTSTTLRVVIMEPSTIPASKKNQPFEKMQALLERGFAVTRATSHGKTAPTDRSSLLVLGHFNDNEVSQGMETEGTEIRFRDSRTLNPDSTVALAEEMREATATFKHGAWKPWFPVIDYDRCTNCMQCLSFCLFGVYGVDDGDHIQVQNNDQCKTNCPACSRVCPEAAIMFPKYKTGHINGDQVASKDLQREKMKIDISALLGGDVYDLLRTRSEKAKSRFSKERNPDKALNERVKCLNKLAKSGDIPPEVLMSLPSADEIQRRAVEAKAKADAALEKSRHSSS
jgi:Pyruvate/2-oxoacid:ferredoxin oxidoreductase delta subunit